MSPVRAPVRVHGALLLTQVAFACLAVEGKLAMSPAVGVSPAALAMARILGGALVFGILHVASRGRRVASLGDALKLGGLSLLGITLNQALYLAGLHRTSPIAATLLCALIPVFATTISVALGRDRVSPRTVLGIALALLGVGVLTGFALPALGDALVMLNALSYALYVICVPPLIGRYGAKTVIAWVFGWGAIFYAPLGLGALVREAPHWSGLALGLVGFLILVPTLLAYGLNVWALGRAKPSLVTTYVFLQPLAVVALARVQLEQPLVPSVALAALLIFAGVGVVALREPCSTERARADESQSLGAPATPLKPLP